MKLKTALAVLALVVTQTLNLEAKYTIVEANVLFRIQDGDWELVVTTEPTYIPFGRQGDGLSVNFVHGGGVLSSPVNCGYLLETVIESALEKYSQEKQKHKVEAISVTGTSAQSFSVTINDGQVLIANPCREYDKGGDFAYKVNCSMEKAQELVDKIRKFRGNRDMNLVEGTLEKFKKGINFKTEFPKKPSTKPQPKKIEMD